MVTKEYPWIKGLTWHRHPYYSFFAPMDWHLFQRPDDVIGVIVGPDPADPLTVFAVTLKDLGTTITPDDLDVIAEGFFGTIEQLPGVQIEHREQKVAGKLLELQTKYSYFENDTPRKCWVRVFYHETRQITMRAQGSTPERYDYWLPMFYQAMMTAKVHKAKPRFDINM
ncbi:MAG: hypothetical protein L0154_08760 [Chloroflexi bacterium]|nr:hypothetical protein [Chloroflexota bacterium]